MRSWTWWCTGTRRGCCTSIRKGRSMVRLVQLVHPDLGRRVAVVEEPNLRVIRGVSSVYELADEAIRAGVKIEAIVGRLGFGETVEYDEVYGGTSLWQLVSPID